MLSNPIRILNQSFELLAEIDDYSSLIINRHYNEGGTLELTINANKINTEFLQIGNIIFPSISIEKSFIIRFVEKDRGKGGKETEKIKIIAIHLLQVLNQRITVPPASQDTEFYNNTNAETIIKNYINNNIVNAVDTNRNISLVNIAITQNRGLLLDDQTRYKNLYEESIRLTEPYGLGQKITLDSINEKFIYDIFEGVDRTSDQIINPAAVFSTDLGNIESQQLITSLLNYRDTAYTAGQGEGLARTIEIVNPFNAGINRFELFVDARDINTTIELQERGFQKLQEFPSIISYNGNILNTSNTKYEEDWDLGDIITFEDKSNGIREDKRIIQVSEIYEGQKLILLNVDFGKPIRTFQQIIQTQNSNFIQEITK